MCGIAGILCDGSAAFPFDALGRLDRVLAHRGPDDRGFLLWSGGAEEAWRGRDLPPPRETRRLALVHRRLAIIDLSPGGWQPMASADGSCDIVYNGEIYNYRELRDELAQLGHSFHTASDTEVLLAGYRQWGRDVLPRLVGMFAFALCDWRRRVLLLARDFFGIKPLYHAAWRGGFAFASEIKGLLELPQVSRRVAPGPLYDYLTSGVVDHGRQTLLADIRELPPAHVLELPLDSTIGAAAPEPNRYWRLPEDGPIDIGEAEAATRLRELFLRSVELHLRSDVPLGAALSGGINSSAIVAAMRRLDGAAAIHSFTFVADSPAIDEERWADIAGAAAGVELHKIRIGPEELLRDLDGLIAAQDLPFGSTSIYAQHRVFRAAAAAGIKVMLDGQGADEMFAGYRPYLAARVVSLLREGALGEAWQLCRRIMAMPGESASRNLARLVAGLLPGEAVDAALRLRQRTRRSRPWLIDGWFRERGVAASELTRLRGRRTLAESLRLTFSETSLPALLRYEDRNSMAHSIESRVPFLTPELVSFTFRLPERLLVSRDGLTKSVLRQALRGLVPDAILERRDKIGFQTPEHDWLTQLRPSVEQVLSSPSLRDIPVLDAAAMRTEFGAVMDGRMRPDTRIWRWLNLVRWSELVGARYE